ncbi:MAG: TonB-dependent receptor [Wenzhouxiangellaceae bacterium]
MFLSTLSQAGLRVCQRLAADKVTAILATVLLTVSTQAMADSEPLAHHEETINLPDMTVEDHGSSSMTVKDVAAARAALETIAGGATVIDDEQFKRGVTADMADILAGVPGVFARSRFGGDEVRLSIRGSGLTQTFGIRGVRLLRDGMLESEVSGFTNPELIDFLSADYVEVYRGANALQYGAATLGGAINFVSKTGYTAEPLLIRIEGGSNDYLRPQISAGKVFDNGLDAFVSVSGITTDGFRDNAEQGTVRGYANLGYRHGDSESRLHLTIQDNHLELPGPLRLAQLRDDPTQANGFWARNAAKRDFQRYRLALQHNRQWLGGDLSLSAWYEDQALDHPLPFVVIDNDDQHFGFGLRHQLRFDSGLEWVWGALTGFEDEEGRQFAPAGDGEKGALRQTSESQAYNIEAFTELRWPFNAKLQGIAGVQGVIANRETEIDRASGVITDDNKTYEGLSPRLGLLWQAADSIQLFTNFSWSYEPPSLGDFVNENDPRPDARATLRGQRARTFEIGSRGELNDHWRWDLALYTAWIDREILQQETSPGSGQSFTLNVDDTRHSGIELGVQGELPLGGVGHYLGTQFTYTYNRFEFDDHPQFDDNRLAGVPEHLARLELMYHHPSGFFIGPVLDVASGMYVDFANTLRSPNYTLLGARAGYISDKGWRLTVVARNLEDQAYVSNTGVTANANGQDGNFFNPGQDRAVFATFEYRL